MAYRSTEKTQAKKQQTRLKILTAAKSQVLQAGFASLSMSALAKQAEVATGSLYRHFANKTELCTELFCQASAEEVAQLALIAEQELTGQEKIVQTIEVFLQRAFKGANLAWSLIAEPLDPSLEQQRMIYRRHYVNVFEKIIQQGISENCFASADSRLSATAIVGALAESLVEPLAPNEINSKTKITEAAQQKLIQHMQHFCLRALTNN